jgi:hypothetical protein
MDKRLKTLIGITKEELDSFIGTSNDALYLQPARLIPFFKPGNEMALTSIFLSSLKLITEYRKMVFSETGLKNGKIHIYTEVCFPNTERRIDGMILVERAGKIIDAAILEMKNKNNEIDSEQIQHYAEIAKEYAVSKIITVSNQFVSNPKQSPVSVRVSKNIELFHFSWSYLLTLAHILLTDNDTNIEDANQVNIMREVVHYFENENSGICGFNEMKKGWKTVVENINNAISLNPNSIEVQETALSWAQEERDMALILSRKLGLLVECGEKRHRDNFDSRISEDITKLLQQKELHSVLKVRGTVSEILVTAFFQHRAVEMSVNLNAPQDKSSKGRIGWLKNQFKYMEKRNPDAFSKLASELTIDLLLKGKTQNLRYRLADIDNALELVKDKQIAGFNVALRKDFGRNFSSPKKFVETIEEMLVDFYTYTVQYLSNWTMKAPRLERLDNDNYPKQQENDQDIPKEQNIEENDIDTSDRIESPITSIPESNLNTSDNVTAHIENAIVSETSKKIENKDSNLN